MPGSDSTETGNNARGGSRDRVGGGQVITRFARASDLERFYGRKLPGTVRAYIAELDGEVAGVIGVIREYNYGKFFADFKPELEPFLKSVTIMRTIKAALRFCDEYRGPVISVAEHAEGCRILTRLGFDHLEGRYYAWLN